MRTIRSLFIMLIAILALNADAQLPSTYQTDSKARIEPLRLGISFQKTTNLIFPYAIKSVDRGSADVLVQKAKGVENVLQVKAAKDSFQETNLTVITADGLLYSFMLNYSAQPTSLNLELSDRPMGYVPLAIFAAAKDNQEKILTASASISGKKKTISGPIASANNIRLGLRGIFIRDNILYFQLAMENNSDIGYDIEQLRFYIIDKKKSKRTASQELEQHPILMHGNATVLYPQSGHNLVVALEKFTIPDKKELVIQLIERNGGRHLSIRISNHHINKTVPFN